MRARGMAALTLVVLLVTTLVGGTLAQAAPVSQRGGPLRLRAVTFNPSAGESARTPLGLTRRTVPPGPAYYLVQSAGPVTEAWKAELAALGVELLAYVPDNAFKVRMSAEQAADVRARGITSYVGLFHPFYAVSPELAASGEQIVRVRVEQGGDQAAVLAAAITAGAQLIAAEGDRLVMVANRAQIESVAQALDVAWIEPYTIFEKHNQFGGGGIIAGNVANARGYDGSTQIAAVADTGIGGGTATSAHRDIPASRVAAIQNFPGVTDSCFQTIYDDGAVDVDSGHGTHVAGSVLSGGNANGIGKGVAPAARLVFQAIENYVVTSNFCKSFANVQNDYYLTGLDNLTNVFQQAYNAGARIHANSWGSDAAGDYTANSVQADDFIWDNKDFTITFSAGNSGVDANADGQVDFDSIGAPATAKNVITIGASENERPDYACDTTLTYTSRDTSYQSGQTCASMGGNNFLGTAGQRWGFTAEPLFSDPSAGNQEQLASFSSRGPTDDNRIKPDVVAPGTWILSTYSDMYQEGYDAAANPRTGLFQSDGWGIPYDSHYKYFGGTSMSNPIAAGAATVVRDFYQKVYGASASAALVKASLINSAVDLQDENNDGANDNDFPIPNNHEGWGRVNLDNATDGSAKFFDGTASLATNGTATYSANVTSAGPLKISVVWSDFASTETAAINLVNDLDVEVTSPSGTLYRGNVFGGGWSSTGGSADRRNNVENVYIAAAATGTWTIAVKGFNIPNGPQPFAIVVDGANSLSESAPPPPTTPAAPSNLAGTATSRTQINLTWTDNSNNETGFRVERCTGATCTNFVEIGTVGANVTSANNSGLTRGTTYRYRIRAYNSAGNSAYSNIANVTTR